jgi:hypothetical protein
MRLKPTPMNEAAVIFSITWVLIFCFFMIISMDPDQGLRASSISIIFLIVSYVLWIATGHWWRKRSSRHRFFMNISVSSAVAIGALLLINQAVASSTVADAVKTTASGYMIGVSIVYYLASVIAAALTQFLIVKPKQDKI